MTPDIKKSLLGGLVATIVMTLMVMFVAPMMGVHMDIAAMIAGMLGTGYMVGMLMHFLLGVVVFPLVYAYLVYERAPGSALTKGLIWGVVLWIVAVVVVMPMAGAGFLMANVGGMMAVVASLMAHLVYGGILGAMAGEGGAAEHA